MACVVGTKMQLLSTIEPIVYKRGGEGSLGERKTLACS